jgi:CheY-like chemotaxis protein
MIEGTTCTLKPISELLQGNGELLLIVDDDAAVQSSNQSLLESHHYSTLVVNDGIEAIALYAKHQNNIKAVLMDIMMPNMDGVMTIRTLQKMNPKIQIIAVSGLSSHRESVLAAGAKQFLEKPYTVEQLLNSIYDLVNNQPA